MTDTQKTPTAEPTDEQRAAVEWLRAVTQAGTFEQPKHAETLLAALPAALTNPMPTEPGMTIYGGRDQPRTMFRLTFVNSPYHWIDEHGNRYNDHAAREVMGEWEEQPPHMTTDPENPTNPGGIS